MMGGVGVTALTVLRTAVTLRVNHTLPCSCAFGCVGSRPVTSIPMFRSFFTAGSTLWMAAPSSCSVVDE